MNGFVSTVVGLMASLFLLVGSVAILLASIALAATVHWSLGFGVLLFPVWAAAMIQFIEWSSDL
jgi:hypothetical protein